MLIAGGVLFLVGAALAVGSYAQQAGWKSVETTDVTPLNQPCEADGKSASLYRYAYYVDGQTYYYDECRASRADGMRTISYDPQDPYTATMTGTTIARNAGFIIAALGLLVTIGAQFLPGKPHA